MKKKTIVLSAAVIALVSIIAALVWGGKRNTPQNDTTSDLSYGVVADFNDRKNEVLSYATLTDRGTYWELADNGADEWFHSTLTFTLDGVVAGNTYSVYIRPEGDWKTYGGGYWLIYDGSDSGTLFASQEVVDEPVSIPFTPVTSSIRVIVMPTGSYLWDDNIKTARFTDFRIEGAVSGVAVGSESSSDLATGTAVDLVQEPMGDRSVFSGKTCVCIGDSVTGLMAPPDDYPSVLASNTGMTVYNCGFEGCRMSDTHPDAAHKAFGAVAIADGIATGIWETQELYVEGIDSASYPQEHLDNLKKIDWSDVDYLTIFYGGNDAGNYVTIDNPQDPMDTTTYLGAARYVYDRIHTAYPGIRIIFFVPMYRYWLSEEKDSDEMTFEMGSETYHYYDWGDALLAASSSIGVPVVDMYRILGINASNRTTFLSEKDQTHPSEAGNKLIASKIEEKLFTEFISRRHSRPGR